MNDTESPHKPDSEEWFMQRMVMADLPVTEMLEALDALNAKGGTTQAEERARALQTELLSRQAVDDALRTLGLRAQWMPPGSGSMNRLRDELADMFREDQERRTRIELAGLEKPMPPAEAVRRLRVLMALQEGTLCMEKSWGFGVVRRLDPVAKKIEIDFESKTGAALSYSYAAEGLNLPGPDHLLSRWHRSRETVETMIRENAAEVVRIAIRSFGPLTSDMLKRQICPRIVAEADWKKFWESARKALRNDPLMVMPAKRTEPMVLHEARERYGREWFAELSQERDLEEILECARMLASENRLASLAVEQKNILANRLAFVVRGADSRHPGLPAEAVLRASEAGLSVAEVGAENALKRWSDESGFIAALHDLPARELEPFMLWMQSKQGPELLGRLQVAIPKLYFSPLQAAMNVLLSKGDESAVAQVYREGMAARRPSLEMLLWLHRNEERAAAWAVASLPEFARFCLMALESDAMGERLKARNQLRDRFDNKDWLRTVMQDMTIEQRGEFMHRVKTSPAWGMIERQAVVGHIIKAFPELESLQKSSAPAAEPLKIKYTSQRSYHARQKQLQKLVRDEIPKNSREINHARSFGDLRENFEYKAAKEQQAVLMRRQAELEQLLHKVQPTDFRSLPPASGAGVGTQVTIARAGGGTEVFNILGEWDRDDALNIISCETKLARALEGHRAGEEVFIPDEHGETSVRIVEVKPLPDPVLAWAGVEPAS